MNKELSINNMIRKDISCIINKIKHCHSKSMYNRLVSDLSMLYNLANILKLNNILDVDNYAYKRFPFKEREIEKKQKNFYLERYEYNSEMIDNYINLINKYEDSSFKYNVTRMNCKDNEMLISDFLSHFDNRIYNVFKKCVDDNRFIYLKNESFDNVDAGLTFFGNYFKPYVLVEDYYSIFTALISIHEVGHIYDCNNLIPSKYNYVEEIFSHFLELVFCDYLEDNKIDFKNIKYSYIEDLQTAINDLLKLLQKDIVTNLEFSQKYSEIYFTLEYTYGMILALNFYDIYTKDKELGIYQIDEFSKNKNDYKDPFALMKKFNFDKEEILEGKVLEKYLKRI